MGAVLTAAELARAARPGDYLAILAYLPPRPQVAAALGALRAAWAARLGIPPTLRFRPRYLHSPGPLPQGGPKPRVVAMPRDPKSTRLNSSYVPRPYSGFFFAKKKAED